MEIDSMIRHWDGQAPYFSPPALFLIDGNDETAAQLGQLKGQFDALSRVIDAKKCPEVEA